MIRALWTQLAEVTGSKKLLQGKAHPHIALTIFESQKTHAIERGIKVIAQNTPPIEVSLDSVGTLLNPAGVVYLTPTPSEALRQLHQQMVECVGRWGQLPFAIYQPGQWLPHCVVAIGLSAEQIGAALTALHTNPRALPGRLVSVAMVDLGQMKIIWEEPLKAPGKSW